MIRYLTALAARIHRPRCPECGEPHFDVAGHVRDDHPDLDWSSL